MLRAYFDSNMAIYFVERHPTYFPQLIQHLLDATGNARVTCVTSDLVRLEARLLPMRDNDNQLLALYDEFFGASDASGITFDRAVFDAATHPLTPAVIPRCRHHPAAEQGLCAG